MTPALEKIRRTLRAAFAHDVLDAAKSAAYSAIFCLFPAILLITTVLALAPGLNAVRGEMRGLMADLLPDGTIALLHAYFSNEKVRSGQVLLSSSIVSLVAAMGVILSLMEGFRKAYNLPRGEWPFWIKHLVAFALIPSCLAPLAFATGMVAFGHQIELWAVANTDHTVRAYVLFVWRLIRWAIGLLTTICLLAVVYHFGTPRRRAWRYVMPGAVGAACMWFLATLLYGFYITRFSNYSVAYGSLGAVAATLVWLYIASLSVLMGAEFNAQFYPKSPPPLPPDLPAEQTAADAQPVRLV